MQTFTVKRTDSQDFRARPGKGQSHGISAPGRIVLVLREGSCWVQVEDGLRRHLSAQSVVIWEPGDWVEYGHDAGEGFGADSYWEDDLTEEEREAIFADVFGPENRPLAGVTR
jgi:hypothetical protein